MLRSLKVFASAVLIAFLGNVSAKAQNQPAREIKIGFVFFLSGGGAAFGIHAERGAKIVVNALNEGKVPVPYGKQGIGGLKIVPVYLDEAGGVQRQLAEYRRLVDREKVDVVIGYNSSGDCNAIGPLAEELKKLTITFYCGHQTLFEEVIPNPKYVFRTAAHGTMDQIGAARYMVSQFPNIKTIAGINQDYSHGQESWAEFKLALQQLKPETKIVSELFPKVFAGEYGSEITSLLNTKPDLVYNTFWGGDADAFVLQAKSRGLANNSRILMTLGTGVIDGIGEGMIPGTIVGARGPYSFFAKTTPLSTWFRAEYKKAYSVEVPPFGAYAAAQAILAYKTAWERAAAKLNKQPSPEEVAESLRYLEFESVSGFPVKMSLAGGHQAIQPTAYGTYEGWDKDKKLPIINNVIYYDAECVNPPANMKAKEWIESGFKGAKCN